MDLKSLFENSLYTDPTEKSQFENNKKMLATAFWINLIGAIGIYIIDAENYPYVKQYFKTDKKLQLDNITDDNNDTSLLIPLIKNELGMTLANQLTRFLVRLKMGQTVDEALFKQNLVEPIFTKLNARLKALPKCIKVVKDYIQNNIHLEEAIMHLMYVAKVRKFCDEFLLLARKAKYKQFSMKPLRASLIQTTAVASTPGPDIVDVVKPDDKQVDAVDTQKTVVKKDVTPKLTAEEKYIFDYIEKHSHDVHIKELLNIVLLLSQNKKQFPNINNPRSGDYFYSAKDLISRGDFDRSLFSSKTFNIPKKFLSDNNFNYALSLILLYIKPETWGSGSIITRLDDIIEKLDHTDKNINEFVKEFLLKNNLEGVVYKFLNTIYRTGGNVDDIFLSIYVKEIISILLGMNDKAFTSIGPIIQNDKIIEIFKKNMTPEFEKKLKSAGIWPVYAPKDEKVVNINLSIKNYISSLVRYKNFNKVINEIRDTFKLHPATYTLEDIKELIITNIITDLAFPTFNSSAVPAFSLYDEDVDRIQQFINFLNNDERILTYIRSAFEGIAAEWIMVCISPDKYSDDKKNEIFFSDINYMRVTKNLLSSKVSYKSFKKYIDGTIEKGSDIKHVYYNVLISYDQYIGKNFVSQYIIDNKKFILDNIDALMTTWSSSNLFMYFINDLTTEELELFTKDDKIEFYKVLNKLVSENIDISNTIYKFIIDKKLNVLNDNVTTGIISTFTSRVNLRFGKDTNRFKLYIDTLKKYPKELMQYDEDSLTQLENNLTKEEIGEIFDLLDVRNIKFSYRITKENALKHFTALNAIRRKSSIDQKIEDFAFIVNKAKGQAGNFSIKRSGVAPITIDFVYELFQEDPTSLEKLFNEIDDGSRNIIFNEIKKFITIGPILNNIHNSPIIPMRKLDLKDIKNALKFNNFDLDEASEIKIRKNRGESDHEYLLRYIREAENIQSAIPEPKVERQERSEKELAKLSYDFNKQHHAGAHGEIGAQILEEFNVTLKMGDWEAFREEWETKGDGILNPAFHGTNGVAASMILRFGFAVLSRKEVESSGGKYAGAMLGAGVYSAPNIDKVSNYIGDSNYGRLGGQGYMFMMDETLGKYGTHYRSAGVDGSDGIRSPEYCAKYPREQIKIVKCFKVAKSSLKYISNNAKNNGIELNEEFEKKIWGKPLIENDEFDKEEEVIGWDRFIFMDGFIPYGTGDDDVASLDEIVFTTNEIEVSECQDGLEIAIKNNSGSFEMFKIYDAFEFSAIRGKVFERFISLIKNKYKVTKMM